MNNEYQNEKSQGSKDINNYNIKTTKVIYPQVYSYILPDLPQNIGSQKIGYTERLDVDTRIFEQTHTAAIKVRPEKLWSAPAFFNNSTKDFNDKLFHKFLTKSNVQNRLDLGKEWFYFNGTPEKSKQLFDEFREKGFSALQINNKKMPYVLRTEQQSAVDQTKEYFETHEKGEFLWNAKPRFGKTLASYDLIKRLNAKNVLIVTNRPAIANSWFDDFEMFVDGYYFISETSSLSDRKSITRDQYIDIDDFNKQMVTFLSLQDLKGSKYFGGDFNKLKWVADLEWDLLIVDEAHEGVDTGRTDAAFNYVKRKNTLHLSGTPFKAIANNKFSNDAIFNWTYLDEQKIKKAEIEEYETGDHTDLPNLKLYTYRISQMIADEVNDGIEIDNEARDYAFDLNEFFTTKNQKFVHESDVREFLKNLTKNAKYPFSTPELRNELKHTFWFVGNRVESVKALEQLLSQDEVFKDYKVIVAAGDGKTFEEEENDFRGNEKSFDKVKRAIKENPKTITLSCGQLTTGVTIKEWSAVLMLTDIKAPAQYMQAAFRAQNPYKFYENNELKVKESAYLFDFAPTRVLEIYDKFANALNPKAVNGEITELERKENIRELLNYFPVISEDIDGQMVELDAEKVLTFPNALAAAEIVKARFMTNLLFNDNIKGVFSFPKEVEDILDKMPIEKNKRIEVAKKELDLDDARKFEQKKQAKINENSSVILGEKIYRTNIERIVDNTLSLETPDETLENLPDRVAELVEPVIAKYKEVYKATNVEIDDIKKETEEKIKIAVVEYENSDIKDPAILKENLKNIIEHDFVATKVDQKETNAVEEVKKTKEDEIRDRLRSFTRTIPMFIMANSSKQTITIDNFDLKISDEDFVDLTNITKDEFYKLRDGFNYEENGERKTFGGVFDRYKFNASISEFVAEKKKKSDYFKNDDDIFELIPNQKNNQIFTPKKVVKMMIDDLEKEQPDLFQRADSTFIDLYMKSGLYITEIVKKLFNNTRQRYSSDFDCVKHILENQVYGLAPTSVLYDITKSFIFGFDDEGNISSRNFAQHDLLPEAKDNTASKKLAQLFGNGGNTMKFDAVVGNPPYQINDEGEREEGGGVNASASPIYHYFVEEAKKISRYQSLIMPARWTTGAGKGLNQFSNNMLNDKSIKKFVLHKNSQRVFPSVDIKGGVCHFLRDEKYNGEASIVIEQDDGSVSYDGYLNSADSGVFIPFSELVDILEKVRNGSVSLKASNLQKIVSVLKPYGLRTDFFRNQTKYNLPKVNAEKKNEDDIEIFGLMDAKRTSRFIPRSYPVPVGSDTIDGWKVFIPYAYGCGAIGEVVPSPILGSPILGSPIQICTETYLRIGNFKTRFEAEALLKYIKTKFLRVMVGILKTTQHSTTTYRFVPLQDFTENSDIDWLKSIQEIDQQLYKKYSLNQKEIDFIETRVKEMV
jgi:hypothetical protein